MKDAHMPEEDDFKKAALNFRVTPKVKALVVKAAKADSRSVASWMEWVLLQRLRADGLLNDGENE